jgi:16S rRNA processing protein RimM
VDVFETGANDVIVVQAEAATPEGEQAKSKAQERLLPFVADVVLEVDLPNKTMLVDWDADF